MVSPTTLLKHVRVHTERALALDLNLPKGTLVVAPYRYGEANYRRFLEMAQPREPGCLALVGLNPGAYGATLTGIPWTDIPTANERYGLHLEGLGLCPPELAPHYGRGKAFSRTFEESSRRVYGFGDRIYGDALAFFCDALVVNGWPLFAMNPKLDEPNVTPGHLDGASQRAIRELAAETLQGFDQRLRFRGALAFGAFAQKVLGEAMPADFPVVAVKHPGRSGLTREAWADVLADQMREAGLLPLP
ncbi:MAG TPA: hypothetical protein VNZ52_08800 [Candidatus Thermoplasmatota archaeon]|nr:hypothetical protein [Candidatus Thermoplasmatota archaeon]